MADASALAVIEDRIYVTTWDHGHLWVVDMSHPEAPPQIGSVNTPDWAQALALAGDLAFIADQDDGLQIIDIATPAAPLLIGGNTMPNTAVHVAVAGNLAFVADYHSGLWIFDVSLPTAPTFVSFTETPGSARGVTVRDETAYVADELGLHVIDVSTPSMSMIVGSVETPHLARRVTVGGDLAYVADYYSLQIVDVSEPSAPEILGGVDCWAGDVKVIGDHAFAVGYLGFTVIDVASREQPSVIAHLALTGYASGIDVAGDLAYISDGSCGMHVIDIANPSAPVMVGCSKAVYGYLSGVVVDGEHAYLSNGSQGLLVLPAQCGMTTAMAGSAPGSMAGVLFQNQPNPFNPTTRVRFELMADTHARLQIVNVRGQLVRTLLDGWLPAGPHQAVWNGRDGAGRRVGSGIYLSRLRAGETELSRKMVLMK